MEKKTYRWNHDDKGNVFLIKDVEQGSVAGFETKEKAWGHYELSLNLESKKTAKDILIENDLLQASTEFLNERIISTNPDKFEWAMEQYADQFRTKWHDPSVKPKNGTHSVFTLDDDGDCGLMYFDEERWLNDCLYQGVSKWCYTPKPIL